MNPHQYYRIFDNHGGTGYISVRRAVQEMELMRNRDAEERVRYDFLFDRPDAVMPSPDYDHNLNQPACFRFFEQAEAIAEQIECTVVPPMSWDEDNLNQALVTIVKTYDKSDLSGQFGPFVYVNKQKQIWVVPAIFGERPCATVEFQVSNGPPGHRGNSQDYYCWSDVVKRIKGD